MPAWRPAGLPDHLAQPHPCLLSPRLQGCVSACQAWPGCLRLPPQHQLALRVRCYCCWPCSPQAVTLHQQVQLDMQGPLKFYWLQGSAAGVDPAAGTGRRAASALGCQSLLRGPSCPREGSREWCLQLAAACSLHQAALARCGPAQCLPPLCQSGFQSLVGLGCSAARWVGPFLLSADALRAVICACLEAEWGWLGLCHPCQHSCPDEGPLQPAGLSGAPGARSGQPGRPWPGTPAAHRAR